eukprot:scaffold426679_cov17-Prasinocladus_malaysianus.AAC.2
MPLNVISCLVNVLYTTALSELYGCYVYYIEPHNSCDVKARLHDRLSVTDQYRKHMYLELEEVFRALKARFDARESREEDVARIRELEAVCARQEKEVVYIREQMEKVKVRLNCLSMSFSVMPQHPHYPTISAHESFDQTAT